MALPHWPGEFGCLFLLTVAGFDTGHSPPELAHRVADSMAVSVSGSARPSEAVQRVRGLARNGCDAEALLRESVARSPTVERLVQALEGLDLAVLVEGHYWKGCPTGHLSVLQAEETTTAVLITVCARNHEETRIVVLAHELQHALEIAEVVTAGQWRVDHTVLERFARRASPRGARLETDAAVAVGARVHRELANTGLQQMRASRQRARKPNAVLAQQTPPRRPPQPTHRNR